MCLAHWLEVWHASRRWRLTARSCCAACFPVTATVPVSSNSRQADRLAGRPSHPRLGRRASGRACSSSSPPGSSSEAFQGRASRASGSPTPATPALLCSDEVQHVPVLPPVRHVQPPHPPLPLRLVVVQAEVGHRGVYLRGAGGGATQGHGGGGGGGHSGQQEGGGAHAAMRGGQGPGREAGGRLALCKRKRQRHALPRGSRAGTRHSRRSWLTAAGQTALRRQHQARSPPPRGTGPPPQPPGPSPLTAALRVS